MGNALNDKDREISVLLGTGDPACMRVIFEAWYRPMCLCAMRYLPSVQDAEDVVQSVLLSFWNNRRGREFTGSVRAYLFAAVVKSSLKALRNKAGRYFVDLEMQLAENSDPAADENAGIYETMRLRLEACIAGLPGNQRMALVYIVFRSMPYRDVAREMGVSVNTVKTHYARALARLREIMDIAPEHP